MARKRPLPTTEGLSLGDCDDAELDGGAIETYTTTEDETLIRLYLFNFANFPHAAHHQVITERDSIAHNIRRGMETNNNIFYQPFIRNRFVQFLPLREIHRRFRAGRQVHEELALMTAPRVHDFLFTKNNNSEPELISKPWCYLTAEEIEKNTEHHALAGRPIFRCESPIDGSDYCCKFYIEWPPERRVLMFSGFMSPRIQEKLVTLLKNSMIAAIEAASQKQQPAGYGLTPEPDRARIGNISPPSPVADDGSGNETDSLY